LCFVFVDLPIPARRICMAKDSNFYLIYKIINGYSRNIITPHLKVIIVEQCNDSTFVASKVNRKISLT
jgi:hypothetical protein